MSDKPAGDWTGVHPDFDGHLENPLEKMTVEERLDWIWQMMLFQDWVRKSVIKPAPDESPG